MHAARIISVSFLLILGAIFPGSMEAQVVKYDHPMFDIGFEASPDWEETLHSYNGKVFEVTNPNNNMRVNLSYIAGCRNPQKHMKQLAGMEGMITPGKPYDTLLNEKKAVIMQGMCIEGKVPYRRLVIGIPGHEGLYLMEICCPEDCYANHKEKMQTILGTLHVGA